MIKVIFLFYGFDIFDDSIECTTKCYDCKICLMFYCPISVRSTDMFFIG